MGTVRLTSAIALACRGAAATLILALPGCGEGAGPVPHSCVNAPQDIERALAVAPDRVALADGTRLSACVARATSDADLQNVGAVFTAAADDLARSAPRDPEVALRLGYLVGACRRGGAHTQGVSAELVRHVEQSANFGAATARVVTALHRGLTAGQRDG